MAQVVKATELKMARRGRRAQRDQQLLDAMKNLKTGEALILSDEYGKVSEDERSRVYQSVKAHWNDAREDACRISFDPATGFAQVEPKPAKAKGKVAK